MTPDASSTPARFRLLVVPERAALPSDAPATLRLLVRVQAPERGEGDPPRDPLAIALVLDRSGSMSGQPLEEACACARTIVDRLDPADRVAVFAFDDEVECLAHTVPASERTLLHAAIARIVEGGSTNLHGGWRAGADELAAHVVPGHLQRVILLSDGNANRGETDLETIAGQCRDLARLGVSTSTYGLGRDFNEALMLAMARAGRGNAYYGQTAADLADPFAEEFDLLSSLCARDPVLKVIAPVGSSVRVRNDLEPVPGAAWSWRLPDIAFGAEGWAIVEIDLPEGVATDDPAAPPVAVTVEAGANAGAPLYLMAPLPPIARVAPADWASMPVDPLVARRLEELEAADLLQQVRSTLASGDLAQAQRLLEDARARLRHSEWAAEVLATIARLVADGELRFSAKEAGFASRRMRSRLASLSESDASFCASEVPSFLRRKAEQGKSPGT